MAGQAKQCARHRANRSPLFVSLRPCGSASPAAAALLPLSSLTLRHYNPEDSSLPSGSALPVDTKPRRDSPSFFKRSVGPDQRTPCITSGYTAFGSPAPLFSSDFKARRHFYLFFNRLFQEVRVAAQYEVMPQFRVFAHCLERCFLAVSWISWLLRI